LIAVPSSLTAGTYYVIAEADSAEVVAESFESNNTAASPTQVGADLVISALTVPAKGGGAITVSDTTKNQGTIDVPSSMVRFYLSTNLVLDSGDTPLPGSRAVPALAPGATDSGSTTLTIPASTPAGTYYLIAKADADDTVPETQETNNTTARSTRRHGPSRSAEIWLSQP
jgi:subtilase family serine protease